MKRVAIIFSCVLVLFLIGVPTLSWLGNWVESELPKPRQPKFGFKGEWRMIPSYPGYDFDERPLPPAKDIWQDYESWRLKTGHTSLVYVGRLGGADRQSNFRTHIYTEEVNARLGIQKFTNVEFTYHDPTNGTYIVTWSLRGEHDTRFLRFDTKYRLYQFQLYGSNDGPPKLGIVGIEGIKPSNERL